MFNNIYVKLGLAFMAGACAQAVGELAVRAACRRANARRIGVAEEKEEAQPAKAE